MISVQNRLPEPGKENRVKITQDSGSPIEGVLAYADNASQQGTFWNRKTAQLLQGDIRTYPVREGQSISAGDVVNVGRELLSGTEQTYGDLPVGSTIQINENGSPVDYLVVHQGNPDPELYDESCNGTWLLRKDIAEKRAWDSGDSTVLESSDIQSYLNGDWMNRYDSDTMGKIKTVKIPYRQNGGYNGTDRNGANGLSCRIFLLSGREVGWDGSDNSYFPNDGAKLVYFIDGTTSSANNKRIANLNGSATDWWLRSPSTGRTNYVWYVNSDGDDNGGIASYSWGVRPAFIVDSSILTGDAPVYGPETVYKDVVPQDNVENVIFSSAIAQCDVCNVGGKPICVIDPSQNVTAQLFLLNPNTGSLVGSYTATTANTSQFSLDALSETTAIMTYSYASAIRGKIITVSDTSLSVGNESIIFNGGVDNTPTVLSLGADSAIFVYSSSGIKARIFSISGTAITTTGTVYSLPNITGANYISACRLPDEGGNKRVCICFSDTGDGNKGKAVIATISADNAVTFGDVVTFASDGINGSNNPIKCCEYEGNVIVIYNASTRMRAMVLTISGNSIATNSSVELLNGNASYPFVTIVGDAVVLGYTNNAKGYSMVASIDGTTIIVGNQFIFANSAVFYISSAAIYEDQFVLAYADAGNSSYGTTTILEVNGNQIAGSFIDNSSDAIALAGGTGGQSIPVGFGGYCECPGVTEGETIDSSGVRAFSPLDGWLKIYEDFSNIFVGSYLGDGVDTRVINIGFRPKFILVFSVTSSTNYVVMCGCVDVSFDNTGFSSFIFRDGGYYAGNTTVISLNDNGFVLGGIGTQTTSTANLSGNYYKYVAWR